VGVAKLVGRNDPEWVAATRHPFLTGVRDGTVHAAAFDTWLGQDRLFVDDLLWFQARLLARAPGPARQVLVDGCAGLVSELTWFDRMAAERGQPEPGGPLPATAEYRRLLEDLDTRPVPVALTALWTIERVYLEAWGYAAPGAPQFRAFVEHWTVPEFVGYVDALTIAADTYPAPDGVELVRAVLRAEVRFWDTALTRESA
jgi:thiaminase